MSSYTLVSRIISHYEHSSNAFQGLDIDTQLTSDAGGKKSGARASLKGLQLSGLTPSRTGPRRCGETDLGQHSCSTRRLKQHQRSENTPRAKSIWESSSDVALHLRGLRPFQQLRNFLDPRGAARKTVVCRTMLRGRLMRFPDSSMHLEKQQERRRRHDRTTSFTAGIG